MFPIDLRSDTVTRPTPRMREVMASADVGDDVFSEDPSTAALESHVAGMLGKEAALFVPSGTMSNQIALLCHTSRGDEVYVGEGAHCAFYESGAGAAWSGVQFVDVGEGGLYSADELAEAIKPVAYYMPNPRLVVVENTHNRGGGRIFPQADVVRVAALARTKNLGTHLDGARLWNAAVASGKEERELARPFDTVSVCFSKGLGAPVGSALVGSKETILKARRFRKMLGGGMRQCGVLAAAALHALEHHRARLAEDHARASQIHVGLSSVEGLTVHRPDTNIVLVDLAFPAEEFARQLSICGVQVSVFGAKRLRLVTHLDVNESSVAEAIEVIRKVASDTRHEA